MDINDIPQKKDINPISDNQHQLSADEFNAVVDTLRLVREAVTGGGTMYNLYLQNNMESLSFATQQAEKAIVDFTFISQYRNSLEEPYKVTGEVGICEIMVKNSKYTNFTLVKSMEVLSGTSIKQDVSEWLVSGSNSVKFIVKGENSDITTAPLTFSIQLTSLGVSAPNFAWWNVFSTDFNIPMLVSGNISKTLHVTVTGDDYIASYEKGLGTSVYTDTPYNYSVPHPGKSGIFTISFYLSNQDNTIQTSVVSVNVMCISTEGEEVKLMCLNNVADEVTNWQNNILFQYAIYDGQAATSNVLFTVHKEETEVFASENDSIATCTRYTFSLPLEIETDDDSDFSITIKATDDEKALMNDLILNVDNSFGYSATAGASLYINPRTRNNSQSNHLSIVNEVDKSLITTVWKGMNWGNDGWVTDGEGERALKIAARSQAVLEYQPFAAEVARKGITIEIDYRIDNVTDATQEIISIKEALSDGSRIGLVVSGENVSLFSQSRQDSSTQDVPTDNGVRIRLTVVIMPDAYGNDGFNLVCIYVNGKKNRQFAYESNDYFKHSGSITLGNDAADLYLYGMRIYDFALTAEAVQKNYINLLVSTEEKQQVKAANEVMDAEGSHIDFDAVRKLYNVFVFNQPFPNINNPSAVGGNLEVFFKEHPEKNFSITQVLGEGQGTSSKKYYEWNIRFKLNGLKDAEGKKIASITTYADGSNEESVCRMFEGMPKSNKLTAKKNWASSMQDHKAGSVALYDDLHREMGLSNAAQEVDSSVRVAVYQEPFIGFSKSINEEGKEVYTCMGEFTFGPDKGDDGCFGYDTDLFPELISVEGSDNAPLGALFRVPWNSSKSYWKYNPDEEAIQYNNTNCWDFDAGELNEEEDAPYSMHCWQEAYNMVYRCNNRISPFNGSVEELNNDVNALRTTGYEYWIAKENDSEQYNLYYYEAAEGRFLPSDTGDGNINLHTQLSSYLPEDLSSYSMEELNEMFINARVQLAQELFPHYFDIDDAVLHHNFTELFAGTDQRAKNTYPYRFRLENDLWRWRVDDADTILPIDNQGQDRKPYYCEMHDFYDNGQPIWNGETSVFWNLLEMAFPEQLRNGMHKMLNAMEQLSGQSSGTPYEKVYECYKKYFLGVKEYFPITLVNADAQRYENAKLAYIDGKYTNDTDPLTQSHGDFYSAETAWMKKRIMYIMSKYGYGLFSADGTDCIIVRAAGDLIDYEITPAFDMYPAIANGTSLVQGPRTPAGETCLMSIDLGGSADQQNAIQAASWLLSIGDWHKKNVSGSMIIKGRRLRELILGSQDEEVVISITNLTLSDCGSLQELLLSNITTLQGSLNLSACPNIRKVYANGTALSQIKLPDGGGLEAIAYPAANKYIHFRNFPLLTNDGLIISECVTNITDFLVENCPSLNPMGVLATIIEAQSEQGNAHALKHIRAVWKDEVTFGADIIGKLSQLADGTYNGLDSNGISIDGSLPVLDGTIICQALHKDHWEALSQTFNKLIIKYETLWIKSFKDPNFEEWVLSIWDTDGDGGVSYEEAAIGRYSDLSSTGLTYEEIDFRELILTRHTMWFNAKKVYVGQITRNANGYSNLGYYLATTTGRDGGETMEYLDLSQSNVNELDRYTCEKQYALKEVVLNDELLSLNGRVFRDCTALEKISPLPDSLTSMGNQYVGGGDFYNCTSLKTLTIGKGITAMKGSEFENCTSMESFYIKAVTPPTIGTNCFKNNPCTIYVPIGSGEAYRNAENWSAYADRIVEYDFDENS